MTHINESVNTQSNKPLSEQEERLKRKVSRRTNTGRGQSLKNKIIINKLTIRQSPVVLLERLVLIQIIGLAVIILANIPGLFLETTSAESFFQSLKSLIGIGVFILMVYLTITTSLDWLFRTFEIHVDMITLKNGILNRRQRSYDMTHVSKVRLLQGFLGRIFKYGTIIVSNPTYEGDCKLLSVSNPEKVYQMIKHLTSDKEQNLVYMD